MRKVPRQISGMRIWPRLAAKDGHESPEGHEDHVPASPVKRQVDQVEEGFAGVWWCRAAW